VIKGRWLGLLVLILLAGCTSTHLEPKESATVSVVPSNVARPLDVRGVAACSLLDQQPLRDAGFDPESARDTSNQLAMSCEWGAKQNSDVVSVAVSADFSIERVYAAGEGLNGSEKRLLRGYPAFREGASDSGICTFYVAVTDTQLFSLELSSLSTEPPLPCERVETLSSSVIDALEARSR
jgi:hypothetical protein